MNTLREKDGHPPIYPTVQDSEVPVLVTNQGSPDGFWEASKSGYIWGDVRR